MSEYTYTKSITSDFSGNFNSDNLVKEIISQGFTPNLLRVDRTADSVTMVFNAELSAGEQTTLNNTVVPNHTGTAKQIYKDISISLKKDEIKTSSYSRFGTFTYPGSNNAEIIKKVVGIGYMDSGVTDFSIRVFDKTNDLVLAEGTFTNTSEAILDLGTVSNVPVEQALLEISVKKTGGTSNKKAYIDSLTLYYGS